MGGAPHFLGASPFALLFLTLALGTALGRFNGVPAPGSTGGSLLPDTALALWAYLGYEIRYAAPALLTTVFLNLFGLRHLPADRCLPGNCTP